MSVRSKLKKLLDISECFARHPRLSLSLLGQFPRILGDDPEVSLKLLRQLPSILGRDSDLNMKLFKQLPSVLEQDPELALKLLRQLPHRQRGVHYARRWKSTAPEQTAAPLQSESESASSNPLQVYFESQKAGTGTWKLLHYFDIYERHFSRFVDQEVNVLAVGVSSGISLEMWRHYFGSRCRIYGVDLEPACKRHENEYTKIFLGDQEDRPFWKALKKRVPAIDILIDDGGHKPIQQIVTLEQMLPYLRPGGVYLCEDVAGEHHGFAAFMQGLVGNLNQLRPADPEPGIDGAEALAFSPTEFQAWIQSIHFYPCVTVIEKTDRRVRQLIARRHGIE